MSLLIPESLTPIRDIADITALEAVPLDSRLWSHDVNDWLRRGLAETPAKTAISFVPGADPAGPTQHWRYAELQQKSTQIANVLSALGVTRTDAVLYLLPTTPLHFAVMLGALATGIACCINWMLKPAQLIELIRSSRAKVIVAMGPTPGFDIWEKVESIRGDIDTGVHVLSLQALEQSAKAAHDLMDLAAAQPADRLIFERRAAPDDVAAYIHSGGTTGSPKLVKLTHGGLSYKCWANAIVMAHTPDDVIFADYPMFHVAGFFGRGVLAMAGGMSIVIPTAIGARDKGFIQNYWKFVDKFRISILSGVPTTLAVLAKNPPRDGEDLSSLRPYMCTGSTSLPVETAHEIERITGVRVLLTYGATEYTQNVAQGPRDGNPKYGSAGLRLPYSRFKTAKLNASGEIERDCAADEIGIVLIQGPSVTPGYVDPLYNEGVFTSDGWFNSGDLGRIDADGYLWLTGRAKDVIIRGGHNIDPSIIEETLRTHRGVMLVAAVGKPDAHAGELPVAYVQLAPGSSASSSELVAFAFEHITEQAAAPKDVYLLEAMPLTDVGKPDKNALRRDAARRTYGELLSALFDDGTRCEVALLPHPVHGHLLTCRLHAVKGLDRARAEARIQQVLKSFAVQYAIEWT